MKLRLTPEALEAAYNFLKTTKPFSSWKLPDADDLAFFVTRHADRYSHMVGKKMSSDAEIAVSEVHVNTTQLLIESMAHEMIHLHQHLKGLDNGAQHNSDFKRRAARVCAIHGFDPATF